MRRLHVEKTDTLEIVDAKAFERLQNSFNRRQKRPLDKSVPIMIRSNKRVIAKAFKAFRKVIERKDRCLV